MKKNFLFLLIGFTLFSCSSTPEVATMTPLEYNNKIIGEQNKMMELILKLGDQNISVEGVEQVRLDLITQCKSSIDTVKAMPAFDGNTRMRDGAVKLFEFYLQSSENQYKEMIKIIEKGDAITPDDLSRITVIQEELTNGEKPLDAEFQTAQKEFASKNKLMLETNKLQKELDNL